MSKIIGAASQRGSVVAAAALNSLLVIEIAATRLSGVQRRRERFSLRGVCRLEAERNLPVSADLPCYSPQSIDSRR